MRSGQLHQTLHAFASEAAAALTAATARGEEVGFEVVEERARAHRPALYCYRPLTAHFVNRHWHELRDQPAAVQAIAELGPVPGLGSYLERHQVIAEDEADFPELALRCFIARVFDGCDKSFPLLPERFEPAYRELFENAVEQRTEIALIALLRGVTSTAKEIALGQGVLLAPLARLGRVPPDPAWTRSDRPALVVAIDPGEDENGVERALAAMLELQRAMRLYAGGVSFAPLAWIHADGAQWRALPLAGAGGRVDGRVALVAEQQDELRSFCAAVSRRAPADGALGWALRRFELGCARESRIEALTDHLLALRALLEPEGAGSGRLAGRLAALCAEGSERGELQKRVLRALALEQSLIGGGPPGSGAAALAAEIEDRLRSLLRDVVAGELRGDLAALADSRIYMPDRDPDFAVGEFQVTRAAPDQRFGSDLFATPPREPSRPGYRDGSVFGEPELPTTPLRSPSL